jgi:hypothetical protein
VEGKNISAEKGSHLKLSMQTSKTEQIGLYYLKTFYFTKSNGNILAAFAKHRNKHTDLV